MQTTLPVLGNLLLLQMSFSVLYQDDYLLAVCKPSNMLVHHSAYAGRHEEESLLDSLKKNGFPMVYPLHRLDSKTSGIVLMAKNRDEVPVLAKLFENKQISKTYLALLRGYIPDEGNIETPVRNERGNYREALTRFKCLQTYELNIKVPPYPTARYSLAELSPATGRWHQLRQHTNKISHPIIGDHKHGNRHHNHFFAGQFALPDLFLHASNIDFEHPFTQLPVKIKAPLPGFWQRFFDIAKEFAVQ